MLSALAGNGVVLNYSEVVVFLYECSDNDCEIEIGVHAGVLCEACLNACGLRYPADVHVRPMGVLGVQDFCFGFDRGICKVDVGGFLIVNSDFVYAIEGSQIKQHTRACRIMN